MLDFKTLSCTYCRRMMETKHHISKISVTDEFFLLFSGEICEEVRIVIHLI